MRKQLLVTVLAMGSAASIGFGAAKDKEKGATANNPITAAAKEAAGAANNANSPSRAAAEKVLKDYYGNGSKVRIYNEREVNGVQVYTAAVDNGQGEATATATGTGHLITTGLPIAATTMTPGAEQAVQGLFNVTSKDVDQVEGHYFFVHMTANNQPYIAKFDAAGRLLEFKSPEELREDAPANAAKLSDAQRKTVQDVAAKRFAGEQISDIRGAIHDPGYSQVFFKNQHGSGWAIINDKNDVTEWRVSLARTELPQEVQTAITSGLKTGSIGNIQRGDERFYRVVENVGSEQFILHVRPNGAVLVDQERMTHPADAQTAGGRTSGSKK